MKISIVIPAYNEENYIRQCLDSVLERARQSEKDIEIIVVNNASTDKTREIALSYKDVKLVDEPIKGLPQARHAGFIASTGELIANVDADSKIPPGWIEKVHDHFASDEKLVALSGPYVYYDYNPLENLLVRIYYYSGYFFHKINQHFFGKSAILQGGNFVLRRDALEKIGGYNLDIKFFGEDTDIAMRIQKHGKMKFSFDLPMHTSARRLKKEGLVLTGLKYAVNHVWTLIFKKPVTKKHEDIRE